MLSKMLHFTAAVMNAVNWSKRTESDFHFLEARPIHLGHRLTNRHVSLCMKDRNAGLWRGNCHGDVIQSQRICIPSEMPAIPALELLQAHFHKCCENSPCMRTGLGFSHECLGDRETPANSITLRCSAWDPEVKNDLENS